MELFKSAQTRSGDTSFFEDSVGRAQRALDEAVKDNDFIYHERVPDVSTVIVFPMYGYKNCISLFLSERVPDVILNWNSFR